MNSTDYTLSPLSIERLKKMAAYLNDLPRDLFYFGGVRDEESCGTVGCIAGHLPDVFPEVVKWDKESKAFSFHGRGLDEDQYDELFAAVMEINFDHAYALTTPNAQWGVGLPELYRGCLPQQAAAILYAYVAKFSPQPQPEIAHV